MTEINPNLNPVQPSNISQPAPEQVPGQPSDVRVFDAQMQPSDLNRTPQASIGQSQVPAPDNINTDVQQFVNNPEVCEQAMEVGALAQETYKAQGDTDAELKALNVEKAFVEEFAK